MIYDKAIELLHQARTSLGFVASINDHDNYKRVWTRDGIVTGLAALLSRDQQLIDTFNQTLQTIFAGQHPSGFFPSNTDEQKRVSYGGTAGRVDNVSWAILGLCHYSLATKDHTLARKSAEHVSRGIQIMDAWEFNGKHLMYVPQSGDWADEYFYHGYVLFNQLLRVWALRCAAQVYQRDDWQDKANQIQTVIRNNFWRTNRTTDLYASNLAHQMTDAPSGFWFMGFNPSRIYKQFDLLANTLVLMLQIGTAEQDEALLVTLNSLTQQYQSILPSFYPAVHPGDEEFHELKNNYAYSFKNFPHQFHNGGLWPVWNGWTCAVLHHRKSPMAETLRDYLHNSVQANGFEFNECLHGETKQPAGVPKCVWSAAGTVVAEQAFKGNYLFTT